MKIKLVFALLLSLALFIAITSTNASTPTENCRAVHGNIQEFQTSDEGEPLATRGNVTGSLMGRYKFELGPASPSSEGSAILFFSG